MVLIKITCLVCECYAQKLWFTWDEALYSTYHIFNRILCKNCDKIPYELWRKKEPYLKYFKVWGVLQRLTYPLI